MRIFKKVSIKDPMHYFSDYLMVLGILTSSPIKENRRYLNGRKRFPLKLGRGGPMANTDALFTKLKGHITEMLHHPRRWNIWIT
jgi:hypothetical protein